MNLTPFPHERRASTRKTIAIAVVLAGAVSVGLGIWRPAAFWPAYLVAVMFVLGNGLGCLAIALLHRMTGGRWGMSVLRELIACASAIPVTAILLLPLVWGASDLYPWLGSDRTPSVFNPHQQEYFAPTFWIGRSVFYVVIWTGLALFAAGGYRRIASTSHPAAGWHTQQRLSAIGLIAVWITVTFAVTDWLMTLEPQWTSTIYGAIVMVGFVVGGWSLTIVLNHWLTPRERVLSPEVGHDVGNMLLAFLLVWVYLAFSQYLIIWSGDLPYEISWYLRRNSGLWGIVGTGLMLFHFVVPFALLLFRENKRDTRRLVWVAAALLFMRLVDLTWLVLPAFHEIDPIRILLTPLLAVAMGGAWLGVFLWIWQRLPDRVAETAQVTMPANSHPSAGQEGSI